MENPNLKWMMTGGTSISGNLHETHPKISWLGDETREAIFSFWYNTMGMFKNYRDGEWDYK